MRVIAGSARSVPLCTPPGNKTRPTTDKLKETLFNIIAAYIPQSRCLDLFCGSGALGVEALSRGAASAVFVDKSPTAIACTRQNLSKTRLDASTRLITADSLAALNTLSSNNEPPFDLIFMDPPYGRDHVMPCLTAIYNGHLLSEDGLIVIEQSSEDYIPEQDELDALGLTIYKERIFKTTAFLIYKHA